jgi:hypothetical protein
LFYLEETAMKILIAIIALTAMSQSASAGGNVNQTLVRTYHLSDSDSYETARIRLIQEAKVEFIEFAAGSVLIRQVNMTIESLSNEILSWSVGQIRTEIIQDARDTFYRSGGRSIELKLRFTMTKKNVARIQKMLERKLASLPREEYPFTSSI